MKKIMALSWLLVVLLAGAYLSDGADPTFLLYAKKILTCLLVIAFAATAYQIMEEIQKNKTEKRLSKKG